MSPDLAGEPSWRAALEEALETLAAQLEGCGDQELVIRGEGEDGDISLDILQPELGPLPRTSVPDRMAAQILLAVDIEGPDHATPAAAFALFQIFSAAVEVSGLTLTWRPRPAIPTALAPTHDFVAGICLPEEEHNEFFFGPLKARAGS